MRRCLNPARLRTPPRCGYSYRVSRPLDLPARPSPGTSPRSVSPRAASSPRLPAISATSISRPQALSLKRTAMSGARGRRPGGAPSRLEIAAPILPLAETGRAAGNGGREPAPLPVPGRPEGCHVSVAAASMTPIGPRIPARRTSYRYSRARTLGLSEVARRGRRGRMARNRQSIGHAAHRDDGTPTAGHRSLKPKRRHDRCTRHGPRQSPPWC